MNTPIPNDCPKCEAAGRREKGKHLAISKTDAGLAAICTVCGFQHPPLKH